MREPHIAAKHKSIREGIDRVRKHLTIVEVNLSPGNDDDEGLAEAASAAAQIEIDMMAITTTLKALQDA